MLFERDHANPDIQHALEHARVLRAQYLRQLFSIKTNQTKKSLSNLFHLASFYPAPSAGLRHPAAAASQNS
jgi:hypothetical protein